MRQAIQTSYIGPTNTKGSRIKAKCEAGSLTVERDHSLNHDADHARVAQALATRLGWHGEWIGGGLPWCRLLLRHARRRLAGLHDRKGGMTMEIDITDFVTYNETWAFSGSIATHGPNAGPNTWRASLDEATRSPLLKTEDELEAMRQWAGDSGGWTDDEIAAWSDDELNALFIQLVSGDMREAGMDECEIADFDWATYRERTDGGGNIYPGDIEGSAGFGRIFYYLGS